MDFWSMIFSKKDIVESAIDKTYPIFSYRFRDASMPPEYHRSYTIIVTPNNVEFSVDVYGTILSKKNIAIKNSTYQSFISNLSTLQLKEKNEPEFDRSVGGKTEYLTFTNSEANEIKGEVYYSGGQSFSSLAGDVIAAISIFKNLVPNLQKRVDNTR